MGSDAQMQRDALANSPWWAKVAVTFGRSFVFDCLLLAALLGWIPSPMTRALEQNQAQMALLQKLNERAIELRNEMLAAITYNNMLTRALCRNMVPASAQTQCEPHYRGYEEPTK